MPTHEGAWAPVLDGSGWERYATEDGVLHRQFKGVDDEQIAKQAEHMRNDISAGRGKDVGNMAFHMPVWLLNTLEVKHGLNDMTQHKRTKWWKRWQATPTGQKYKVRGI
jgi:hypothetical protein